MSSQTGRSSRSGRILELVETSASYDSSKRRLYERIIYAILNADFELESDDTLMNLVLDISKKMESFSKGLGLDDIYTIDDDFELKESLEKIKTLVTDNSSSVYKNTINFTDVRVATIAKSLSDDPETIDLIRYLLGMGDITFELKSSIWLHNADKIPGPLRKLGKNQIKRSLKNNYKLSEVLSRGLLDLGLRSRMTIISKMERQERQSFVELLSTYQSKGRLAKLRGHMAERMIANMLKDEGISFEPIEKLATLGSADVRISFLNNRLVDFAIPNSTNPKVLVQVAYYTSNTGSVASKTVRESVLTKQEITKYNLENGTDIKFVGLVDGSGWIDMSGHLIKMLLCLDDFFQLKTKKRLLDIIKS